MSYKVETEPKYKRALLTRLSSPLMKKNRPFAHFSPPLELKYIEALLGKCGDFEVKVLDCHIREYSVEEAVRVSCDFYPDLLIIDINSYEFQVALDYVKLLKRSLESLVVIAIGQDPTTRFSHYLELSAFFDIILPGEPEAEAVNVLNDLNNGKDIEYLNNRLQIWFRQDRGFIVADLDSLPFPKYNRDETKRYRFLYPIKIKREVRWGYVLSSRGCPYQCIFCAPAIRKTNGKKLRLRSAANVVDEIEYLKNTYNVNVVCFQDDNFTTSRLHVESICQEILRRRLKIKWVAHARVDEVDYPLLSHMKKAGCELLRFGIESGSERIISILKKTNKDGWIRQARTAFSDTRRLKIATNALFILGSPTETESEIISTILLAKRLKPDLIQIHFFTPYPGSQIYEELKASLVDIKVDELYHYAAPSLQLSQVDVERLKELCSLFYRKMLFSPDFLVRHIFNYGFFYLLNRDIFLQLFRMRRYLKGWPFQWSQDENKA